MDLIGELTLGNEAASSNPSESAVDSRNFGFNSAARQGRNSVFSNAERRLVEPPFPPVFENAKRSADHHDRRVETAQRDRADDREDREIPARDVPTGFSSIHLPLPLHPRENIGLAGGGQELGLVA